MKLIRKVGATSEIWQVFIRDSSSTTGAGLTGLVFNSAGLTAYYHRDTDTTATAITLATMTVGTFTSSGFKEIDATNMPGWYQFCPPNAALVTGAKSCGFHLKGATNMAPLPIEVELNAQVAELLGNTAQTGDNYPRLGAPAGASMSADIAAMKVDTAAIKTKTDNLTFTVTNQIDSNVLDWKSATAPAMTGDAFARLGAPAGASVSADIAAAKADTAAIKIQTDKFVFTITSQVDCNVLGWKSATAPAMTGDAYARLGAPAGASVSVDIAAVKTDSAAIKLKTDGLPSDPADASDITGSFSSIASTLSTIAGYIDTEVAAIKAKTDNLPASFPANFASLAITAGGAVTAGTVSDKTGYSLTQTFPSNFASLGINSSGHISRVTLTDTVTTYTGNTVQTGDNYARLGAPAGASMSADIAAMKVDTAAIVIDTNELQTDWHDGGRLDLILDAAGSAGDPWSTSLPGAYGSGTAGKIIGDNINATVSSRATQASVDDLPTNTELATALTGLLRTGVGYSATTINGVLVVTFS